MAVMIPNVDPDSLEHGSERSTYIALRDQLPETFTVFHSYPWLRMWRGERDRALLEGETDFVVLNAERGLLVLEVKGGQVSCERGVWQRRTGEGLKPIHDPFQQARGNMHALLEIARDYSGGRVSKADLNYGYAVVFPDVNYRGAPPPNADAAIIISERDMPRMNERIDEAYRAWTDKPRPLTRRQFDELVRCITPEFQFVRPIGAAVAEARERLLMLTETQAQIVSALLEDRPRMLVEGPAGSGKTILALGHAARLASKGRRTLFVCFNKHLAAWLSELVAADKGLTEDAKRRLQVWNFHALAADVAGRAKVPFAPPADHARAKVFWEEGVADILQQAFDILVGEERQERFGAVVVDEAQDFEPMWWFSLTEDLLEHDGHLLVFLDPEQSLRGKVERPELGLPPPLRLDTNCRNTRRVTRFSAELLGLQVKPFRFSPDGLPAKVIRAASATQQKGLAQQRVARLLGECGLKPKDIALIGPAAKPNGSLADLKSIQGIPLVTDPEDWRAGGGLLVTTARSFKGLEASAVVAYDIGRFGALFTRADLYVACTRAIYLLELIVHDEQVRAELRGLIGAADEENLG